MVPWNAARTKVQIRLSIQRLRTLQEKKLALAKKSRREIADLVVKGRVETARLRVEGLIQDDIYVELLELLELYSEKLQARFNLLEISTGTEPEESISDAVCAIVYAAPRTELKELQVLREILMHKYGRTFSLSLQGTETPPTTVPARVLSKLVLYTPARELVDAYLYEIAKGYGVDWIPDPPAEIKAEGDKGIEALKKDAKDGSEGEDGSEDGPGDGQEREPALQVASLETETSRNTPSTYSASEDLPGPKLPTAPTHNAEGGKDKAERIEATKKGTEDEELAKRFEKLKNLR